VPDLTPLPKMKQTIEGLKILEASLHVICTKARGFSKNPLGTSIPFFAWHPKVNEFLRAIGDPEGLVYNVSERITTMGDYAAQSITQEVDLSLIEDEPSLVTDSVKMCKILSDDLLVASTQARKIGSMAAQQFDFGTIGVIVPVTCGLEHWGAEFRRMTGKP
jgi:DNA-binding ferritin-like protein